MTAKFLLALVFATAVQLSVSQAGSAGRIDARIAGVRGTAGRIACALFHGPDGFPRDSRKAARRVFAPIGAPCVFEGLPPGAYAVSLFHDDDGSGTLETNLLGAPKKGYGVSNNHTHSMSAPSFEESRVDLRAGEAKTIMIELRY
jgi:uncharacterized protein (DUF2141 family)